MRIIYYRLPNVEEDEAFFRHLGEASCLQAPILMGDLVDVTSVSLLIIFERSWQSWEVPRGLKKASVTPIFKKGKKDNPENYR